MGRKDAKRPAPPDVLRDMGRAISERRRRLKVSRADLAQSAGLTERQIARIEDGLYDPGLKAVIALANALRTGLSMIFRTPARRESSGNLAFELKFGVSPKRTGRSKLRRQASHRSSDSALGARVPRRPKTH
jgi:DNA-binding XRE family transcriptional regulator